MLSDNVKFWIFYGFIILWALCGIVNYFFRYSFQIYLGLMILWLAGWIGIVYGRMRRTVMPAGNIDIKKINIP